MDSEELTIKFLAIDGISSVIEGIAGKIEQFGASLSKIPGIGSALGPVGEVIGGIAAGIGGIAAAGLGVFAVLDHLATQTATYALSVEQLSNRLHINTDLVQTMYQSFKLLGDSTDSGDLMLTRLARNLENGGITLKAYHTSLKDLGVTSTDLNVAIPELADAFSKTGDTSLKAAISMGLFGRSAQDVTAFLSMGSAGIARLHDEFQNLGLILSPTNLAIDTTAKLMQDKLHLVLQGIEMTIGNALIPAFMMLWTVLGKILEPLTKTTGAANALGTALGEAVVWVAAFISALTGVPINLSDITNETGSAIAQLSLMGGTASDTGSALGGTATATKSLTEAIQKQITAVTDQQRAFDESNQSQIDGQRALQAAYDQSINDQIRVIDAQKQQISLAQQLDAMNDTLAGDTANLAMTQREMAQAGFFGAGTGQLAQRMADEQKKLADDTAKAQVQAKMADLDAAKATLSDQKTAYDRSSAEKITGIEAVKKAQDDVYADDLRNLNEQMRVISQNAADATLANQNANAAIAASGATTSKGLTDGWNLSTGAITKMGAEGTAAADKVKTSFQDLGGKIQWVNARIADVNLAFTDISLLWQINATLLQRAFERMVGPIQVAAAGLGVMVSWVWEMGHAVSYLADQAQKLTGEAVANVVKLVFGTFNEAINVMTKMPKGFFGAEGAIVTQPTLALIGESGPEMLQPLNRAPGAMPIGVGSGGDNGLMAELVAVARDMRSYLNSIANDSPAPGGFAAAQRAG